MATKCIARIGPWGGNKGESWSFKLNGSRLTEIWIATGEYIDYIKFVYEDQNGEINYSNTYGGNGSDGSTRKIIFKNKDEELKEMGGTIGDHVISLYFRTNKRTYGPYGRNKGTSFSAPVLQGKFIGFFGDGGSFLDSIGAILQF